ncbi:MAG: polyprenyl synthetase family protein, partial [Bacteroidales bacterium]|nr:polyprenyl synthetase family protein [Bacteroidales bacterium]
DYFDSFGDSALFGKKIGGDIICGKKTWLLAESLKRCDPAKRKTLQDLIRRNDIGEKEKIERVLSIFDELGIKSAAEEAMDSYHKKAIDALSTASLSKDQRDRLIEFADTIINREK